MPQVVFDYSAIYMKLEIFKEAMINIPLKLSVCPKELFRKVKEYIIASFKISLKCNSCRIIKHYLEVATKAVL